MIEEPDSMNQLGQENIIKIKSKQQIIKEINEAAAEIELAFMISLAPLIDKDQFITEAGQYEIAFQSSEFQKAYFKLARRAIDNKILKDQLEFKNLQNAYQIVEEMDKSNNPYSLSYLNTSNDQDTDMKAQSIMTPFSESELPKIKNYA